MRICVETHFDPTLKQKLRSAVSNDELIFKDELLNESDELKVLSDTEIILGNPRPAQKLLQAKNLKWIQLTSTGFEIYTGIKIPALATNLKGFYAIPCAESMIAGIMTLYRGMDRFTLLKENQEWVGVPVREKLKTLTGKKIIILGTGSIGRQVAILLKGFNCSVSFYARTSPDAILHSPEQLEAAIPDADIIIACLPGTPDTRGLFTSRMISRMKRDALFCNVGRGNLLEEEEALVDALMMGNIGGAVLDVTANEPLPPDHPLWNCPHTILSQHTGGGDEAEKEGMIAFFLKNLEAFKNGNPLKNRIILEKGY